MLKYLITDWRIRIMILISGGAVNWHNLASVINLTGKDVYEVAMRKSASPTGRLGVDELAEYLEGRFPGILPAFSRDCVNKSKPYLEEVMPFDSDTENALLRSREVLGLTDPNEIIDRLTSRFDLWVNARSPRHVVRAMMGHIEYGIGNYRVAITEAGFAHCEKTVADFGDKLEQRDPEAVEAMLSVERNESNVLAGMIRDFRLRA